LDLHHVVQIHATQDKHLEKDGLHPYFLCDEFKVEAHFVTTKRMPVRNTPRMTSPMRMVAAKVQRSAVA
jgi:hypothetical protein